MTRPAQATTIPATASLTLAAEILAGHAVGPIRQLAGAGCLEVPVVPRAGLVTEVVRVLDAAGIEVDDVALRRPSLDDVFHALTGRDADPAPGLPAGTTGIVGAAGTTATSGTAATTAPAGYGPPDDGGAAAGPGGERAA